MVCIRTLVHSQPIIKCTIINIKWCVKLCFLCEQHLFLIKLQYSHAQFQYNFQLLLPATVYGSPENIYFPQSSLVGRILNIFIFKSSLKENCIGQVKVIATVCTSTLVKGSKWIWLEIYRSISVANWNFNRYKWVAYQVKRFSGYRIPWIIVSAFLGSAWERCHPS